MPLSNPLDTLRTQALDLYLAMIATTNFEQHLWRSGRQIFADAVTYMCMYTTFQCSLSHLHTGYALKVVLNPVLYKSCYKPYTWLTIMIINLFLE